MVGKRAQLGGAGPHLLAFKLERLYRRLENYNSGMLRAPHRE